MSCPLFPLGRGGAPLLIRNHTRSPEKTELVLVFHHQEFESTTYSRRQVPVPATFGGKSCQMAPSAQRTFFVARSAEERVRRRHGCRRSASPPFQLSPQTNNATNFLFPGALEGGAPEGRGPHGSDARAGARQPGAEASAGARPEQGLVQDDECFLRTSGIAPATLRYPEPHQGRSACSWGPLASRRVTPMAVARLHIPPRQGAVALAPSISECFPLSGFV